MVGEHAGSPSPTWTMSAGWRWSCEGGYVVVVAEYGLALPSCSLDDGVRIGAGARGAQDRVAAQDEPGGHFGGEMRRRRWGCRGTGSGGLGKGRVHLWRRRGRQQ